jgi:hypothetical protein
VQENAEQAVEEKEYDVQKAKEELRIALQKQHKLKKMKQT